MPGNDKSNSGLGPRFETHFACQRTGEFPVERPAHRFLSGTGGTRKDTGRHFAFGQGRHRAIAFGGVEESETHRAVIGLPGEDKWTFARPIAEHDVIHADVAPPNGHTIHDPQLGRAALPAAHVEAVRPHAVVVAAGHAVHYLAVHQQIDTGSSLVRSAADEEGDVIAFDLERLAGQCAEVGIGLADIFALPGVVRVDEPLTLGTHIALVRRHLRLLDRPLAEGRAGGGPALVGLLLEVLEKNVGAHHLARPLRFLLGATFEEGGAGAMDDAVTTPHHADAPAMQTNGIFQPTA